MSIKKSIKNPFVGFSVEQVMIAESCSYAIQVGNDFYIHDGQLVFSKKTAQTLYNKILAQVVDKIYNGDKKQKAHAHRIMATLKVMPLRIS